VTAWANCAWSSRTRASNAGLDSISWWNPPNRCASLVGVPYDITLILGVSGIQLLFAFTLTAFGVMMAARIRQMQAFMALTQMLALPLYLLSGALFPASTCRPG